MKRTIAGHLVACCSIALAVFRAAPAAGQSGSAVLSGNFEQWTTSSTLLNSLASAFTDTFVRAQMDFTPTGLRITGPNATFELAGVQSIATFTAPFHVVARVVGTQGTADPFEVFLVSADLSQYLAVAGNVNGSLTGFWVVTPNLGALGSSLGEQFTPNIVTTLGSLYQIEISVNAQGAATVNVESGGTSLGSLSNLQPGTGPFYLVMGQRVGYAPPGQQVAYWKSIRVTTP